ncbi:MAG TPA: FKBP-type peptidyl-prolyl cis-trans isomerase [Candidatus Thermoplasmatota archaeon]|nr:FKBP-type peptidyl-prolyl cis-trans isomerase [Candidatus Thermoplasmatota archaeon]
MALSTPVKALAFVLFLAAIAGATYAVTGVLGDTVESHLLSVSAPRASVNATGGHNVTYLVTVANRDTAARDVRLKVDGLASGESDIATVRGSSNATLFVTVSIPEDAPVGDHALDVSVVSGAAAPRRHAGLLTLHILPAAPGFGPGDETDILYTGRLSATGRVFNTNDRGLVGLAVPKTDTYRFSDGFLHVVTVPRLSIVPGLAEGMRGMQPGESRTVSFPPEQGYGPATEDQQFNRDDVLQRNITVVNDEQSVARETFDAYLNESGQGDPATFKVGDTFKLDQDGSLWPYRVTNLSSEVVTYKLAAKVGESYTIYPFWPNSSVLTAIDEAHVSFRTTPTTPVGEKFTFKQFWPAMSSLKEVNDTAIVVRNDPPVGFTFSQVGAGGAPREATVKSVNETRIVAALPAQNPLAGKDLTFDVTMVTLSKSG